MYKYHYIYPLEVRVPDRRFASLMNMELVDMLLEHPCMNFDRDIMHRVSVMYGLDIRESDLPAKPTVNQMLTHGFKTVEKRKEFLAHYIVEWEIREQRLAGSPSTTLGRTEMTPA